MLACYHDCATRLGLDHFWGVEHVDNYVDNSAIHTLCVVEQRRSQSANILAM